MPQPRLKLEPRKETVCITNEKSPLSESPQAAPPIQSLSPLGDASPSPANRKQRVRNGKPVDVLIVDDIVVNQIAIQRLMQSEGLDPIVVGNGQAALNLVKQGKDFALIVMDVHMPIMDGLESARRIREVLTAEPHRPRPHIVSISSSMEESEHARVTYQSIGIDQRERKPIQRVHLLKWLDNLGIVLVDLPEESPATTPMPTPKAGADGMLTLRNDTPSWCLVEDNIGSLKSAARTLKAAGAHVEVMRREDAPLTKMYHFVLVELTQQLDQATAFTRQVKNDERPPSGL
eukprot:9473438-Pyramimonas_sp.AAC.1